MTQERILITGAGGFVGGALAIGFAELGWRVIALDRSFEGGEDDRIQRIVVDLDGDMPADTPDVDVIVHAAWLTTGPDDLGMTQADYALANVGPTLAVLRWALEIDPRAVIFLSSSGVFAPGDAITGLTDEHEPTGTSSYARAKRACEEMVLGGISEDVTDGPRGRR